MRIINDQVKTEGNLGELVSIAMSLDEASAPHLMAMFTDLYESPLTAVAREYPANGLDSHRAAKQSRPIEISLPGMFGDDLFRVKDWGVGLNKQDIIEVISKYGASTKRDTDDESGCLGLGCKSALAYAPQFTYIGVKNGKKTTVLTTRDETDGARMILLEDEVPTDEPNGVEVQVPIRHGDVNRFETALRELMQYYPKGAALLNGKEVPQITRELELTDNLFMHEWENARDMWQHRGRYRGIHGKACIIVVMGNIPYPVPVSTLEAAMEGKRWNFPAHASLIAYVPMGAVHFQPSRESLRETDRTKDTVKQVIAQYEKYMQSTIEKKVNEADSRPQAVQLANELEKKYPGFARPNFRGEKVPHISEYNGRMLSVGNLWYYINEVIREAPSADYRWEYDKNATFEFLWSRNAGAVHIVNFDIEKWTRRHAQKLLILMKNQGIIPKLSDDKVREFLSNRSLCIWGDNMPEEIKRWSLANLIIDYADLKEIKLPSTNSGGGEKKNEYAGSYDNWRGHAVPVETLKEFYDNGKLLYTETKRVRQYGGYYETIIVGSGQNASLYSDLLQEMPDYVFVCIPGNRIEKFKRIFPGALVMEDWLEKKHKEITKSLGKRVIGRRSVRNYDNNRVLYELATKNVHDPKLRKFLKILTDPQLTKKANEQSRTLHAFTQLGFQEPFDNEFRKEFDTLIGGYPLLQKYVQVGAFRLSTEEIEHLLIYINAVYNR